MSASLSHPLAGLSPAAMSSPNLEDLAHGVSRVRIVHGLETRQSSQELLLALPPELLVVVLEQLCFNELVQARSTCSTLRTLSLSVTRILIERYEQLWVPLLRPYGDSVVCLEVEGVNSEWLVRLGAVLGVLPKLQRLFVRRAKASVELPPAVLSDASILGVAGALQAGACPALHHFNIDERLPDAKVALIARAMRPDGGLLFAASHGYEAVVEEMLQRGASPEAELEDGATALLVAAYHPGHAIVHKLLSYNADVNPRRHDGVTPLIMASNRGHLRTVQTLLDVRAKVDLCMRDGTTALHTATYKGHTHVVEALLSARADVLARCFDGVSPLLMAAKQGRDDLVHTLLEARAEVDSPLKDGGTALLAASYKGHDNVVGALLSYRATVDACRADGLTPLCQASKAGHTRCVELLLQGGANVEAAGAVYGTTSLLMASKGGHAQIVAMLLRCAAPRLAASPRLAARLPAPACQELRPPTPPPPPPLPLPFPPGRYNADTEVAGRAYGTTSLVAASQHGHVHVVQHLLAGGADPHKALNDGSTALDKAREHGMDEVVQVLRQAMGHEVYEATRGRFVGGQ